MGRVESAETERLGRGDEYDTAIFRFGKKCTGSVLDLVGITSALMVPTYFLALASMASYIGYRVKYSKKWKNFLLKECNPGKELSVLWALLPKTSCVKSNLWSTHFYNVGITLFYAGRREDVEKIFPLFVKYCPDASGEFKYELLRMTIALDRNPNKPLAMQAMSST